MPLLSTDYLSNFQFLFDAIHGKHILLKSFDSKQTQEVKTVDFLQGSISSHVKDIGPVYWETSINSPVFVFSEGNVPESPIDLIVDCVSNSFILENSPNKITMLMNSANISIDENGVNSSLNLISDNNPMPDIFSAGDNHNLSDYSVIGRTARNYDCRMQLGPINTWILSGNIEFATTINRNYYLNNEEFYNFLPQQNTYFSINNYKISGKLKIRYDIRGNTTSNLQTSGEFSSNAIGFKFFFGPYNIIYENVEIIYSLFQITMTAPNIITAEIIFETFTPGEIQG